MVLAAHEVERAAVEPRDDEGAVPAQGTVDVDDAETTRSAAYRQPGPAPVLGLDGQEALDDLFDGTGARSGKQLPGESGSDNWHTTGCGPTGRPTATFLLSRSLPSHVHSAIPETQISIPVRQVRSDVTPFGAAAPYKKEGPLHARQPASFRSGTSENQRRHFRERLMVGWSRKGPAWAGIIRCDAFSYAAPAYFIRPSAIFRTRVARVPNRSASRWLMPLR